jgi:maltooligosyltrehalose synthase
MYINTYYIIHFLQAFGGYGAPAGTPNKSLGLTFLQKFVPKGMVPKYLNSEWSYAQVTETIQLSPYHHYHDISCHDTSVDK